MTTSAQLADQAGITYRQLDHWARTGWLHPAGGTGSGRERDWPPAEQAVARAMGALCQYGISPALAHSLARNQLASDVLAVLAKLPEIPKSAKAAP